MGQTAIAEKLNCCGESTPHEEQITDEIKTNNQTLKKKPSISKPNTTATTPLLNQHEPALNSSDKPLEKSQTPTVPNSAEPQNTYQQNETESIKSQSDNENDYESNQNENSIDNETLNETSNEIQTVYKQRELTEEEKEAQLIANIALAKTKNKWRKKSEN
eukprot:757996_1